ncbi:hypothetical protein CRUP_005090, partial [Coryphaenoides rupestris]
MCSALGAALFALALLQSSVAFLERGVSSHKNMTETAILQILKETCMAVADSSDYEFNPTGPSAEELVEACLGPTATGLVSAAKFRAALQEIYVQNGLIDRDFADSPPHHFNSEAFDEGRGLITVGVASIKANIRKQNYQAARETLGRVLHTLQDFYSHSNWVELGNTEPYVNLIRPDLPIGDIADVDTPTCRDCTSETCANPILDDILQGEKLTSGYMGIISHEKPRGKCSHGGAADLTCAVIPCGGISKDERRPDNEAYHDTAVELATIGSLELLEDIRGAAGDNEFLRMMGIARSSVVCFVIDTTGSMADDIAAARQMVYDIIDSKAGTQDEPSEYILVPFNDPDFGPITRTTNPEEMKSQISQLTAKGGGDAPEMCLSGLQLALTAAPASSHIYVFTDAIAKDIYLKDTIFALIRRTKSTVNVFFTQKSKRKRRALRASYNDYEEMALASGGQAIKVSKGKLSEATKVILDTSTSALVTVLQRSRGPGEETFMFLLDESLKNVTLYITGTAITFQLTSPAGQSTITYVYDFVASYGGPHPGYAPITGRPPAGQPVTLLLSVLGRKGPSSVTVGEVVLVPVSHAEAPSKGFASDMGNGDILVTVDSVPEGEFVAVVGSSAEPGKTLSLPFRVKTEGPGGACSISVRNDRDYPMTYPTVLTLMTGQYANATLEITPPANTPSGTDVTVTIDAKSTTADTNYAVLRLSVVNKITDFVRPMCEVVRIMAEDCPMNMSQCSSFRWDLSANLTDGNGS